MAKTAYDYIEENGDTARFNELREIAEANKAAAKAAKKAEPRVKTPKTDEEKLESLKKQQAKIEARIAAKRNGTQVEETVEADSLGELD